MRKTNTGARSAVSASRFTAHRVAISAPSAGAALEPTPIASTCQGREHAPAIDTIAARPSPRRVPPMPQVRAISNIASAATPAITALAHAAPDARVPSGTTVNHAASAASSP